MNTAEDIICLPSPTPDESSPFHLDNEQGYQQWREQKLDDYPSRAEQLVVEVTNVRCLAPAEKAEILRISAKTNMAIYAGDTGADKDIPRDLGTQFGLQRLDPNMLADQDGITSLQVVEGKSLRGYIPYSNKRLLWHTDGYYNPHQRRIRAFVLHCVTQAQSGGDSSLMDPEILYIMMRDSHPEYIDALMQPDAMTIPANEEQGVVTRPTIVGPVFSVEPESGALHMRYTARTRSIEWKPESVTQAAVTCMTGLMEDESAGIFHHLLEPGQGVISNNVLHKRSAFNNGENNQQQRLIYRARYYDRISHT